MALMLVLLNEMMCEVILSDEIRWHDIHNKFHNDQFRNSSNIIVITTIFLEIVVLVLLTKGIYEVLR
jgi:hypothetical protein